MPDSWVGMKVNGDPMEGYLTQTEELGEYPAVVVIQEIWVVNSHIQSLVDRLPALGYVKAQPFVQGDKIGIVGFCYGGRVSYLASCNVSDLLASVVFYGGGIGIALANGQSPLEQTANISCPMLGLFGEEDANLTPEDVANMDAELTKAGKAHKFHNYGGAGHGFHREARASYRAEAAADGWGKAMT